MIVVLRLTDHTLLPFDRIATPAILRSSWVPVFHRSPALPPIGPKEEARRVCWSGVLAVSSPVRSRRLARCYDTTDERRRRKRKRRGGENPVQHRCYVAKDDDDDA